MVRKWSRNFSCSFQWRHLSACGVNCDVEKCDRVVVWRMCSPFLRNFESRNNYLIVENAIYNNPISYRIIWKLAFAHLEANPTSKSTPTTNTAIIITLWNMIVLIICFYKFKSYRSGRIVNSFRSSTINLRNNFRKAFNELWSQKAANNIPGGIGLILLDSTVLSTGSSPI